MAHTVRHIRRYSFVLLLLATLYFMPQSEALVANYEDWWWNGQQSGQGINIGQQGDVIFVSWFTYDETGAGMWLTLDATVIGTAATGNWIRTTGPGLGTVFDPSRVTRTPVGTGTFTFESLHAANLAWSVNGKTGTLALTRQSWRASRVPAGNHAGRIVLDIDVCAGGVKNIRTPISSSYSVVGDTITVVDDFRATGTKVCTMTGTLVPSGSYLAVANGTYSCVSNTQRGAWHSTLLVRSEFVARDEVLTLDDSTCVYVQTIVTSPLQ